MLALNLTVLLFPEDGAWVAQCLQYDIAEQGATIDDALHNWVAAISSHIESDIEDKRTPLQGVDKAPHEFWSRWEQAKPLQTGRPLEMPAHVPPAWMCVAIVNDLRLGTTSVLHLAKRW